MFLEICSNNHAIAIGKGDAAVYFESRYWVDDNNVFWYSYDDICKTVKIDESMANVWYDRDIPENQKCICMDSNNYNNHNEKIKAPVKYITSETARLIVQQHAAYITERDKNIIKAIDNLEIVDHAYNIYEDAEEIKEYKQLIYKSIEHDDYEEFFEQCYKVTQTETAREVLDKKGLIDKEFEKAVDELRNLIIADEENKDMKITLNKENGIWSNWIWLNE
jgi:hypothetical protein